MTEIRAGNYDSVFPLESGGHSPAQFPANLPILPQHRDGDNPKSIFVDILEERHLNLDRVFHAMGQVIQPSPPCGRDDCLPHLNINLNRTQRRLPRILSTDSHGCSQTAMVGPQDNHSLRLSFCGYLKEAIRRHRTGVDVARMRADQPQDTPLHHPGRTRECPRTQGVLEAILNLAAQSCC